MSTLRIHIDRDLCNGCGNCVTACTAEALAMEDGKVNLISEDFCDGIGDCLPTCPTGALSLEAKTYSCQY